MADRMKDHDNKDAQESGRPVQLDREQQGGKPDQQHGTESRTGRSSRSSGRGRTSRAWSTARSRGSTSPTASIRV